MNQTSTISLLSRLEKLEKENQRMKKAGIVIAVFGTVFIALGQSQTPQVIEANEFRLRDSSGKVRAKLFTNSDGQTRLNLESANGTVSASMGTGTQGSSIMLTGADSKSSLALLSGPMSIFPTIELKGTAGKVAISADQEFGGPSVKVEDLDGFETVIGKSNLEYPKTGKKESTPAASIVLFSKEKKVLWSAP